MAYEVETKVLEVDPKKISDQLLALGATKVLDTKFTVDWFRTKGSKEGGDPWFLRIRTTSDGKSELTWKGQSAVLGDARKHQEFNVAVAEPETIKKLLTAIGLEPYAHQEKYRISWTWQQWRFDLDTYPGMLPYLEIEGRDEAAIQEAIALLDLKQHKKDSGGERVLIQEQYGLDWYHMTFNS